MNKQKDNLTKFEIFDKIYLLPYQNGKSATKNRILLEATILFAKKGFYNVSMKDIADTVGLQPAALYNHFANKEMLWLSVLSHTKELFLIFYKHMEERVSKANSFQETLQVMFGEPEKMSNDFTCYAFALIQVEQFRNEAAHEIFNNYLMKYAIAFTKKCLDSCIERGFVKSFDTLAVAEMYSHNILAGINISVQKLLGQSIPYEPGEAVARLHEYILNTVGK